MLTQPEKRLATCPEKSALKNYLLGKLPEEILDQFEDHFSDCVDCEETLRGLDANDTFSQLVNSAADSSAELAEHDKQFVGNLIAQMKSENRFHRLDAELAEKAAEVTRLLTPPEDESDAIGTFGDYQIESLIGVGSTGVVFRAIDRNLDRLVALKILRPSLGRAARERFMAEARLAAAIEHQNVVTIYQVGEEEVGGLHPIAFIAMQWIAGETLEDRFKKVAFLPEDEVKAIASQIALGLSAAHQKNLIHRDIKPANIWLCEESDRVIILDFGLARIADDDPHMTNTGMLAGTPNFMSPEQTRGQELDGRSDLFSLGCLMYRTATGKLPFGASGVLATLQSIQTHSPNPPATLNPHISEDFSDLVMCLLEKQVANRPENASQLIDAIKLPRTKWSFIAANHQALSPKSKSIPQKRSRFTAWISLAILFGLIASFGYMFAPDIIRIATNQGELIIDSKDKDIKIEVLSGGEVIKVIDLKTSQTIDIKAGEYSFQVQDARNGFSVSPSKLTMTRGGKEVVTISVVPNEEFDGMTFNNRIQENLESNHGYKYPNRATGQNEPTYDGKTFNEWVSILSTERNHDMFNRVFKALIALSLNDNDQKKMAIDAILPFIRTNRDLEIDRYGHVKAISEFFNSLPSGMVLDFVVEEIKSGTAQSHRQLFWLLSPDNRAKHLYSSSSDLAAMRQTVHLRNLKLSLREILNACDGARKNADAETKDSLAMVKTWATHFSNNSVEWMNPRFGSTSGHAFQTAENAKSKTALKPTYGGKTLSEWVAMLKTERDGVTINQGLNAIAQLSCDDTNLQKLAIDAVRPIVRKHGGLDTDSAGHVDAITKFFNVIPSNVVLDFVVEEIKSGTPQSQLQLFWLLSPNNMVEYVSATPEVVNARQAEHLRNLKTRHPEISKACNDGLEKADAETKKRLTMVQQWATNFSKSSLEHLNSPFGSAGGNVQPGAKAVVSTTKNTPTYDGKTFNEWYSVLLTERNHKTINQALTAVGILSKENAGLQKLAINRIRTIAQRHGSLVIDDVNHVESITKFFQNIPSNSTLDFVLEEIQSGTVQSQHQCFWLLMPNYLYGESAGNYQTLLENRKSHWKNIQARSSLIATACIDAMEKAKSDKKLALAMVLQRVIFEATHDPSKPQNSPGGFFALELPVPIQPDDEPREKLFELLTNRLKTTKDAETATFLAIEMLRNDTANQLAVDQIVKSLFDEIMPDWFPTIIFDEFIV